MNTATLLASARAARARMVRGFARVTGAEAALDAAIESRAARAAVAMDTPVGDIQAAQTRAAWTTQIGRLEAVERRTGAQEILLRQLRRNVRELDAAEALRHATPQGLGELRLAQVGPVGRPLGLLGSFGAGPLTGLLMSPVTWVAVAFLVPTAGAFVQTARLNHAKHDLQEARLDVAEANRTVALYRQREREYAAALDKAEEDRDSAIETVQRERTIAQRARAESRRTARELEAARSERGQPIDWGLPVAGDGPTPPPAAPSDAN